MTKFGEMLLVFGKFLKVYLIFGKIETLLWQLFNVIGQKFIVIKGPNIVRIIWPFGHTASGDRSFSSSSSH